MRRRHLGVESTENGASKCGGVNMGLRLTKSTKPRTVVLHEMALENVEASTCSKPGTVERHVCYFFLHRAATVTNIARKWRFQMRRRQHDCPKPRSLIPMYGIATVTNIAGTWRFQMRRRQHWVETALNLEASYPIYAIHGYQHCQKVALLKRTRQHGLRLPRSSKPGTRQRQNIMLPSRTRQYRVEIALKLAVWYTTTPGSSSLSNMEPRLLTLPESDASLQYQYGIKVALNLVACYRGTPENNNWIPHHPGVQIVQYIVAWYRETPA
ncbi:hypothetical protein FN846DRAFT_887936 [Sphaerosporella brunnea]|uniref:Uncharacterized protein n=1 Tax=Sphaerosporella brunnea TaxID=1250544 RepID=A0A5J5F455_9PEZI|nr:hypothetical protein FN846DRAFT_887936 [Sphaerosporella brunnea]